MSVILITTSFVLVFPSHSIISLCDEVKKHSKILAYYMIPAGLYCLYNNLSFTNLAFFDPTTYFLFMQIRLLMTGVIYQVCLSLFSLFSKEKSAFLTHHFSVSLQEEAQFNAMGQPGPSDRGLHGSEVGSQQCGQSGHR